MAAQVGKEGEDYDWNDDGTWAYARTAEEVVCHAGYEYHLDNLDALLCQCGNSNEDG